MIMYEVTMADDKVIQPRPNDTSTNNQDLYQLTAKITFLPGTLQARSDFHVVDGMLKATLLVTMPDDSKVTVKDIPVLGHNSDTAIPEAGSIFKITWPSTTFQKLDSILAVANRQLLQAQFWMTPDDFKEYLTPKGKAALEPAKDAIKPPPFQKLLKTLFTGDKCKFRAPKTIQEAMDQMAANDGSTQIFGLKEPGQSYNSHAMVVNPEGIFMYDSEKGTITGKWSGGKTTFPNIHVESETEHKTMQVVGLPSTNVPGSEFLPNGNIFMPHPKRLPSLEIVEMVINAVDVAKLMVDFVDAYKKMDTRN